MTRAVPTNKRLRPHDPPRLEIDDGLVFKDQLVLVHGHPEALLDLVAGGGPGPHGLIEELPGRLSLVLGPVHGQVGVPEQGIGGGLGVPRFGHHDPDGGGEPVDGGSDDHRSGKFGQDDLGDPVGHVDRFDVGADNDELVAAEPGDGVGPPPGLGQTIGQLTQGQVADAVAEDVVHSLETVEVDEEDGQGAVVPPAGGQGLVDPVVEQRPVGQPGEGVVESLVLAEPLEPGGQVPVFGHQGTLGQGPPDSLDEGVGGHRFEQVAVDLTHGGDGRLQGGRAGEQENGKTGFPLLQELGQFQAVTVREEIIDHHQGRFVIGLEGQGLLGSGRSQGGNPAPARTANRLARVEASSSTTRTVSEAEGGGGDVTRPRLAPASPGSTAGAAGPLPLPSSPHPVSPPWRPTVLESASITPRVKSIDQTLTVLSLFTPTAADLGTIDAPDGSDHCG